MMKRPILPALLLALILATACKKTKDHSTGLVGKWQWQYSMGGIAGFRYNPANTGKNITLQINADSTYVNMLNNTVSEQGSIHIIPDPYVKGSGNMLLTFSNSLYAQYSIDRQLFNIVADTLYMSDAYVNDGFSSKYVWAGK